MLHTLATSRPVFIRFTNTLQKGERVSDDLFCTALARCAKRNKKIIIDCRRHPCAGGNYFVSRKHLSQRFLEDVYIKKESVFQRKEDLKDFLRLAQQNPKPSRYIIFEPSFSAKAEIVIFFTDAAGAGRLLGLGAYRGQFSVDVVSAISTCASLFRPRIRKNVLHLNFIDYFDRYYQCKNFFRDEELLVSMHVGFYKKLQKIYARSSHGKKKPFGIRIFPVHRL